MWRVKSETVFEEYSREVSATVDRFYIENDGSVKIAFRGLDGRVEEDIEKFEYPDGKINVAFSATRVDPVRRKVRSYYTVHLGIALKAASHRLPPGTLTMEHARKIAWDIEGALSVWLLPEKIKKIVGATSTVRDVRFVMKAWDKWNPILEKDWP